MVTQVKSSLLNRRSLCASLAVTAFAAVLSAAPRAEANSGAGGTILNTVTVSYKDAGNVQSYTASATASVTINLVKAAISYSGKPTGAAPGKTAALPSNATISSGGTANYLIALTANANGGDNYNLSETTGSLVNMNTATVSWATVQNDGSTVISGGNPTSALLGASVIQAFTANTISIPGGSSVAAAITSGAGKVLVVNGVDYLVSGIVTGHAASNTHVGNTLYNTAGAATSEQLDVITLAANPSGSNTTPNLSGSLVGTQVGEQILVKVTVTGIVGATAGTTGQVPFTLTTKDSGNGNTITSGTVTTSFSGSDLQIRKTVRNCGQATAVGVCGAGAYSASTTGNPGDILEYKVEVFNNGATSASVVSAQDAVPVYTTLVSFTGAYGDGGTLGSGAATNNFAQVSDGATSGPLTMQSSDTDVPTVGAGDAAGITANSAIHFFLGTGVTNAAGGSIAAGKTYTVLYRMKMN